MKASVDRVRAEKILRTAIKQYKKGRAAPSTLYADKLKDVIFGTHKTYKYILFTGILAKATTEEANPLALQKGSELNGAYDARSLCHNVIVPIERELLDGRLGASNEPFLNKPARFTELSPNNPVRSGNDKKTLENVIEILKGIKNSHEAKLLLDDFLFYLFDLPPQNLSKFLEPKKGLNTEFNLTKFIYQFTSISHEGETAAIAAGLALELLGIITNRKLKIIVHNTNQPGSSSNEFSDIDVYEKNTQILACEVKDKIFNKYDVEHAIHKILDSETRTLLFFKGPNASLINEAEIKIIEKWNRKGINLFFINLKDYFLTIVSMLTTKIDKDTIIKHLQEHSKKANIKQATYNHLEECIKAAL